MSLVNIVEALTALELNSEASRVHLNTDIPDITELRRLNVSALRDVQSIVTTLSAIRKSFREQ